MKMHFEFTMTEIAVFIRTANRYNGVIKNVAMALGKTAPEIEEVSGELPEVLVEKKCCSLSLSATKSTDTYEIDIQVVPKVTEEFEFVAESYVEMVETVALAAVVFWKTIKGSLRTYERAINKFVKTLTEE
jgi:hypothetical protein